MCGIIGIASYKDISKEILESLKKLEYRGYDSAGISTINNGEIIENKCVGKVSDLEKLINAAIKYKCKCVLCKLFLPHAHSIKVLFFVPIA